MRKLIVIVSLTVLIICSFIVLNPDADYYINIMRKLNRDVVYFPDGGLAGIWLWDDKGAAVIGEGSDGEVAVFNKDEYTEINQNRLLRYLNILI